MSILGTLSLRMIIYMTRQHPSNGGDKSLRTNSRKLIFLLENLGFVINHPKIRLTAVQGLDFLGFTIH